MTPVRSLTIALFLLAASGWSMAQTAATPTPTPPDDVVRISTNLIQLDVTVTDAKGRIVTDLKPNEIEVYENGEKQNVTHFSFISNVRDNAAPTLPAKSQSPSVAPLPARSLRSEDIRRTVALVVDDLSLSFESAYYTRRALKKFVDEQMQEGDLVAIVRTGAGIGALQQFTSDKRLLYAAIERVKWNPMGTGSIGAFEPINGQATDGSSDDDAESASGDQSLDDFRTSVFATGTLGALKYVVTGMGQLPGRKSVILFSDGFQLMERDARGFESRGRVMDFMSVLIDAANRNSVTFYTIDARGLQSTFFTAADSPGTHDPQAIGRMLSDRSRKLTDNQDGLRYLAQQTGGFALVNSNDLSKGVQKVLDDQSYYLVAYEPDTDTFDPKKRRFNQLSVKILRPGLKARYRSGFLNFADRPDNSTANTAATAGQQLIQALVSPFTVNGIDLRLNALYGDDARTGPFVRSVLHVDAHDLKFSDEQDGTKKAVIEILAMAFGDNGRVIDQLARSYTLRLPPAEFERIRREGFLYQFSFPIKKPGAFQYRVALRDAQAAVVGSASQFVEVPDLKKKRLTLSSLIIQSLTPEQWTELASGTAPAKDAGADTALRRIRTGAVLRYGYEVYNAKLDRTGKPALTAQLRLFRDGKPIFEGKDTPVEMTAQSDPLHIRTAGALAIGKSFSPGEYVLQIVVTDALRPAKKNIASQFIEFEVVE